MFSTKIQKTHSISETCKHNLNQKILCRLLKHLKLKILLLHKPDLWGPHADALGPIAPSRYVLRNTLRRLGRRARRFSGARAFIGSRLDGRLSRDRDVSHRSTLSPLHPLPARASRSLAGSLQISRSLRRYRRTVPPRSPPPCCSTR